MDCDIPFRLKQTTYMNVITNRYIDITNNVLLAHCLSE